MNRDILNANTGSLWFDDAPQPRRVAHCEACGKDYSVSSTECPRCREEKRDTFKRARKLPRHTDGSVGGKASAAKRAGK